MTNDKPSQWDLEEIKVYVRLSGLYFKDARLTSEFDVDLFHKLSQKYDGLDVLGIFIQAHDTLLAKLKACEEENKILRSALEKIADPRKRDHKEPDAYTELGCVMHIAEQALTEGTEGE